MTPPFLTVVMISLATVSAQIIQPEFFSEENFTGDIPFTKLPNYGGWPENPDHCFNFPDNWQGQLSSVRANDLCVLIFDGPGCTGRSFKATLDILSISDLVGNTTYDDFNDKAMSIRYCNEADGWTTTNVELFKSKNYDGTETLQYENICECIQIPSSFSSISSVDNHHNCIKLHSTSNCMDDGIAQEILPGRSSLSSDISALPIYGKVLAVAPCSIPPGCYKLRAELFNVELINEDERHLMLSSSSGTMGMKAKTVFVNNGTGTVTQEYIASKSVRQVIEVEKMTFSRRVDSWSVVKGNSVGVSVSLGVPVGKVALKLGVSLSLAVQTAYSETTEKSEMKNEKHILDTTTEFEVRQSIKVSPCYAYTVDSMVTVVDGYPMRYKAFFKLSGTFSGKKMRESDLIEELRNLPEYTYSHSIDDHTVVAYAISSITTSFGMDTEIWGTGERIRGCYPN